LEDARRSPDDAGFGLASAPATQILWTIDDFQATAVIPTPIVVRLALLAAGYNSAHPGAPGSRRKWLKIHTIYPLTKTLANKHGGMVLVGDYVYATRRPWHALLRGIHHRQGKMEETRRGRFDVAPVRGRPAYMHFANGTVVLAKASPDDYEVISSFKVSAYRRSSRLVASHDCRCKLFIRYEDSIRCYDIKAKSATK